MREDWISSHCRLPPLRVATLLCDGFRPIHVRMGCMWATLSDLAQTESHGIVGQEYLTTSVISFYTSYGT